MELAKIAVASHDAGGAAVLASYLHNEELDFVASTNGPATQVYKRFFESTRQFIDLASINVDKVITSTSASSDHELDILKKAKFLNIHTISIIDHWVNYKQRFLRNGCYTLPDELWVTDQAAFDIATQTFNHLPINLIENPYKKYLLNKHVELRDYHPKTVLYCTEPIVSFTKSMHKNQSRSYNEFDALDEFLKQISKISLKSNIVIKTHPTESCDKYNFLISKFNHLNIRVSVEGDLIDEIRYAACVVGCNTMALVVANWFNIPTLNSIPNGCEKSILHIDNMKYLYSVNLSKFMNKIF